MKKPILFLVLLCCFLTRCSEEKNLLLPAELIISSFAPTDTSFYKFDTLSLYKDNIGKWIIGAASRSVKSNINITDLIFQKAAEGHIKLYDPYLFYSYYENLNSPLSRIRNLNNDIPLTELNEGLLKNEEWKGNLGGGKDSTIVNGTFRAWENPVRIDEVKSLFFIEKWKMTINPLKFEKEILSWSPVRHYEKDNEYDTSSVLIRKLVFSVLQNPDLRLNRHMIYAGRFQYEYFLGVDEPDNFNFGNSYERTVISHTWSGFSKISLVNSIVELAVTGKVPVYDPKNLNSLSVSKISENLGEGRDSVLVNDTWKYFSKGIITDNILSVIFIENWYINPETLEIYKEGIGIAPVQYLPDENIPNKYWKHIPFVLFYNRQPS